jgi:acyl-CoA thioesterase-2
MDVRLQDLLKVLELESLEVNLFRGESRDIGSPQVFGGQVLGQALVAAYRTIDPDRGECHSLHAYFLRRGDFEAPIVYQVDRSRDGRSFTTRHVTAIQHGEQIFRLAASFQAPEPGLEHAATMPDVPGPEDLAPYRPEDDPRLKQLPEALQRFLAHSRPFEFRPVQEPNLVDPRPTEPSKQVWFRTVDRVPSDAAWLHRCLLAYVSDYNLMDTALRPHGIPVSRLQLASIDHAMWLHRPCRVDEWLLYALDSPSASGARGLSRGSIYTRDGVLVASTAQEGLMRSRI